MSTEEIRVCKSKNCKKQLPENYKYNYCEACRNKRAEKTRKALNAVGGTVLTIVATIAVFKNAKKD